MEFLNESNLNLMWLFKQFIKGKVVRKPMELPLGMEPGTVEYKATCDTSHREALVLIQMRT